MKDVTTLQGRSTDLRTALHYLEVAFSTQYGHRMEPGNNNSLFGTEIEHP